MKKWIAGILIVLSLCILSVYIFIPSPVRISNSLVIKTSFNATLRSLEDKDLWKKFSSDRIMTSQSLSNGVNLVTDSSRSGSVPGKIILVPMRPDSIVVLWEFEMAKAGNFFDRIKKYTSAFTIKNQMDEAMHRFKEFCEKTENVYDMAIIQRSTTDTFIVATKFTTNRPPTYQEIYSRIDSLKKYVTATKATVTGFPMMHTDRADTGVYKCMVALPVDRILDGAGNIFFVRMVPGRFLTAEIKGGPAAIAHAENMMQLYFQDFKRTSMAIPFEYMVSDRLRDKDTSAWVTRIYFPVF